MTDNDRRAERPLLPVGIGAGIAIGVANNPNVGSGTSDPSVNSPDGDSAMEYIMGQVWDAFAG